MSRYLWCLIILASSAVAGNAQPSAGTIAATGSKSILNYECTSLDAVPNRISCDFVQVLLSTKSDPAGLAETLKGVEAEFETGNMVELQSEMCLLGERFEAITTGKMIDNLDDTARAELSKAIESYKSSSPTAKADLERFALDAAEYCREPVLETLVRMFTGIYEQENRSCQAFVNKYTQTYVKLSETLWAVESTPSGNCGVVNTSRFISSPEYGTLWEHETSKIVMNKDGQDLISCSALDESKSLYSWRTGPNFIGCDYLN